MPVIFGTAVSAASYVNGTKQITADGEAFADVVYAGISKIEVSIHGADSWTAADTINSWSDTQVKGTFNSALGAGTYDVKVTSSDGEVSSVLENAFTVTSVTSIYSFFFFGGNK